MVNDNLGEDDGERSFRLGRRRLVEMRHQSLDDSVGILGLDGQHDDLEGVDGELVRIPELMVVQMVQQRLQPVLDVTKQSTRNEFSKHRFCQFRRCRRLLFIS